MQETEAPVSIWAEEAGSTDGRRRGGKGIAAEGGRERRAICGRGGGAGDGCGRKAVIAAEVGTGSRSERLEAGTVKSSGAASSGASLSSTSRTSSSKKGGRSGARRTECR